MNNVLSSKKNIYIAGIILLGIVLSIALIILILKLSSVKSVNSTTDDTASYAVSYTVSYPVSYNNTASIVEQTEIVPLNVANLTKTINTEEYCGSANTANLGIVKYRYTTGDFSTHDQNSKAFLINNRHTVKGENEEKDFAEVIDVIDNKTEIMSLKELHAFSYACVGGAASTFIKTFDMDFPAVDKSLASIYVGGTQYAWAHLSDVKFTIKILAQKGDNVMLMSEYFEGSELMTEDQVQTCSANSGYDYQYLPMECIRDLYKQSPDAQEKVNKRAQDLIKFFEF